jgi:hypothetical protein
MDEIDVFYSKSKRCENGRTNAIRETIIEKLVNGLIPEEYFVDIKWRNLKNNLNEFIEKYINTDYTLVRCIKRGGRHYNYDFDFIYENNSYKVEFKYNCKTIESVPQFLQLGKCERFLTSNYEKYYYSNYLCSFCSRWNIDIIPEDTYLKNVVNCRSDIEFFKILKKEYKNNKKFKEDLSSLSRLSITEFVKHNSINIKTLEEYLFSTQQNKIYMLFHEDKFYHHKLDNSVFKINKVIKDNNRFICELSDYKLNVLLRWKNTLGILNPALQISIHK